MKRVIILNFVFLLLAAGVAKSATLIVKPDGSGDYPTIQAAIDAAVNGDEVVCADGVYTGDGNRDIDFLGKAITVRSENGPEGCIIDCNGTAEESHRGFYFHNDEDGNSVLDGFTVKNGRMYDYGGGIYCKKSSPAITNCNIRGNSAPGGGGICCFYSTVTIANCQISDNKCSSWADGSGGGIFCRSSDVEISNSVIIGNSAFYAGGALFFLSSLTMTNCTVKGNYADEAFGGIFLSFMIGGANIVNCEISYNTAKWCGGIALSEGWEVTITNSVIKGNSAEDGGGGIYCSYDNAVVNSCDISGNSATKFGGGICCIHRSTLRLSNCTVTGNSAGRGGGIFSYHRSDPTVINCIMWDNKAIDGNEICVGGYISNSEDDYNSEDGYTSTVNVGHSDIEGGIDGIYVDEGSTLNWFEGNIDADPCFVEAGYWDANGTPDETGDDFWVEGDYHLLEDSVCINAGDPNYVAGPGEVDLDGVPRVLFGRIDMGAYEYNYIETEMEVTPAMLNCGSSGNRIEAHFVLPEGYLPEDVDVNSPAVAEPVGLESEAIEVLDEGDGYYRIVAVFDREGFCEALGGDVEKELEVTVKGAFTDGAEFYGTDTIKLVSDHWQHREIKN